MIMRTKIRDKATVEKYRFFTTEKIGEKRHMTPEGYLVILDVPIARTGTLLYGPDETPIKGNGTIRIRRDEDDVFHPDHIASYNGKSVTNEHPKDDVDPSNWKSLEVGQVLNPRQGTAFQADLLLADLIIKDKDAITDINDGKREVSCGYTAEYVPLGPNEGKQVDLIGNHVALVERGRCGQRCAIGDKQTLEDIDMQFRDHDTLTAAFLASPVGKLLQRAFKSNGDLTQWESIVQEASQIGSKATTKDDAGGYGITNIHHHQGNVSRFTDDMHEEYHRKNAEEHEEFRKRLAALEGKSKDDVGMANNGVTAVSGDDATVKDTEVNGAGPGSSRPGVVGENNGVKTVSDEEKETMDDMTEEMGSDKAKARDSAPMAAQYQETLSAAEILSPGISFARFDATKAPAETYRSMCDLRRRALDAAYRTNDKDIIEAINGGALNLTGMRCNQVRTLFRGAALAKKQKNTMANHSAATTVRVTDNAVKKPNVPRTQAELNELMHKHYSK